MAGHRVRFSFKISTRVGFMTLTILVVMATFACGDEIKTSIDSDSLAIEAANQVVGLNELRNAGGKSTNINIECQSAVTVDKTTPFIHSLLDQRPAWKVSYSNIIFNSNDKDPESGYTSTKTCEVWLDSASQQLIRIDFYNTPLDTSKLFEMPEPSDAEDQLSVFSEEYLGLTEIDPKVSMIEALKLCKGYFFISTHTIVQYMLVKIGPSEPFPAWVIYMRGVYNPTKSGTSDPKVEAQARLVVNAITGKTYGITNFPF